MLSNDIPDALVSSVQKGEAVLFLGAGASYGATHPNHEQIPNGNKLRDLLSDQYLGGKLKDQPLVNVADYAINETSLSTVQKFIKDIFDPFRPADFHQIIPRFSWHGIASTNYDMVIERAYESTGKKALQTLVPFYKNGQNVENEMKSVRDGLQFIKLHGSIDKYMDNDTPFILSSDQYLKYLDNRSRLFSRVNDWGFEFPIIFCGYTIKDPNIQKTLDQIFESKISRPNYYLVDPCLDSIEVRYWSSKRITPIVRTFEEFLLELDSKVSQQARGLPAKSVGATSSLASYYGVSAALESEDLSYFLELDVDHVHNSMPINNADPKHFYSGYDQGWGGIFSNLDIQRNCTDSLVVDAVLSDDIDNNDVRLFLLKGPGGNGKSISLKRSAWMAAVDYNKPVLFLKEGGAIKNEVLLEISRFLKQRLFLFVDRAGFRNDEIEDCIKFAEKHEFPLTVVTAERPAEWNVRCENLEPLVTKEFQVRYLSKTEIERLLDNLTKYECLGILEGLDRDQQVNEFLQVAERQLLVALHQATRGIPFEELVLEEYQRIIPVDAQKLYLDVCTLNRFGVDVRAGLISRISKISFSHFEGAFFRPLEFLVGSRFDHYVQDYVYSARHRKVAEMVFNQVLTDAESRFDQLIYILDGINIDYSTDKKAFDQMIRGRSIADSFTSAELGRKFFESCRKVSGNEPYVLQQQTIFEMEHAGGNLNTAEKLIKEALEAQPYNKSLKNTYANLLRKMAVATSNPLLRKTLRDKAKSFVQKVHGQDERSPYVFFTRAQIAFDDLKETINDDKEDSELYNQAIVGSTKEFEQILNEGLQRFPQNEHFVSLEASYRELMSQKGKAETILLQAFNRNNRLDWIAHRLVRIYSSNGEYDKAREIIESALAANPSSKQAHYTAARFFMEHGQSEERVRILDHLRRSFNPGDTNYEARFWYARELYIRQNFEESTKEFEKLRKTKHVGSARFIPRGLHTEPEGKVIDYIGEISRLEEGYAFVHSNDLVKDIFLHRTNVPEEIWSDLRLGSKLTFNLAFNFDGPVAVHS